MVCLGAHFSAIWIVVANSWMQTPAGFHIVGQGLDARAQIIDFWAMLFNPSSMTRLGHVILGCWLAGAFLVISVAAYYLLKKRHLPFAKNSIKIGLWVALISCLLQGLSGDSSGKIVAKYQPAKLAAIEALYQTQSGVPLTIFGVPNEKENRLDYQIGIPKLLSYLSFDDFNAEVQGLDQIPKADRPNVTALFNIYRIMIGSWTLMLFLSILGLLMFYRGSLFKSKWLLRTLALTAILPQIANQAGWVTAEMGRYPWIVYGLLRISDGLSKAVTANQILGSIVMFLVVYTFLFVLFIYLLNEKIKHGPQELDDHGTPYHKLQNQVKEKTHDSSSIS
jgi:cytochrome d ubiquinol oxidase subunit I